MIRHFGRIEDTASGPRLSTLCGRKIKKKWAVLARGRACKQCDAALKRVELAKRFPAHRLRKAQQLLMWAADNLRMLVEDRER